MKQLNFILIAIVLSGGSYLLGFFVKNVEILWPIYMVIWFLCVLTILVTKWQASTIEKSASQFVTSFSGGMGIKMFGLLMVLVPSLLLMDKGKVEMGLISVFAYIVFLVENVRQLFRTLKSQPKN